MFNIELLAVAENELSDAYDWYEEQLPGLGNRLYKEINYFLNLIESNPYYFPVRYPGDLHCAVLNKFPYSIIYWIDEANKKVPVLSIFHTSREPRQY